MKMIEEGHNGHGDYYHGFTLEAYRDELDRPPHIKYSWMNPFDYFIDQEYTPSREW